VKSKYIDIGCLGPDIGSLITKWSN